MLAVGGTQAGDTIRIGTFLSVTGPASFLGDPELRTLQMYVDQLNAGGGVLGKKLELVHYDTAGQAKEAVTFVKRLIQNDEVDVIVGGSSTGDTMAAIPEVEKAEVPLISLAGGVEIVEP
ncbi:MAG: ABC transporter substrate-binding protein, partial [Gammaproteobacteria bacterium]|nr:ABC transporter substrate-binding protein [Gammaproteobacteria bacterium]